MYTHILLAADGSQYSLRAAQQAIGLAGFCPNARVSVISVIPVDVYSDIVADPIELRGQEQREQVEPVLALFRKADIDVQVVLTYGIPADEVVRYADEEKADLVIIGSRGLNAVQEFALGSVSHKVVKEARCPVLVVK